MRRDQTEDRARTPRISLSRRRVLSAGMMAAAALSLLAACGEEKVEHGKFKLRSHINW